MFTDEQILNLCYLAYGWERDEETDEMFLDSPVLFPFPYENWLFGGGIVPTYTARTPRPGVEGFHLLRQ